jgi:plasmid stabilization system protein ParE
MALRDATWFIQYCVTTFLEGMVNATGSLRRAERLLAENPMIGSPLGPSGSRKFPVRRTPFTLVYRIMPDRIEILRILDQRSAGLQG